MILPKIGKLGGRTSMGGVKHFLAYAICLTMFVFGEMPPPAQAQTTPSAVTPLAITSEVNGVNLVDGAMRFDLPTLSIPADPHLHFSQVKDGQIYVIGTIVTSLNEQSQSNFAVHYGGDTSRSYNCTDSDCTSLNDDGSLFAPFESFTKSGSGESYYLNLKFSDLSSTDTITHNTTRSIVYYASAVRFPEGEILTYTYYSTPDGSNNYLRIAKISSNLGYYIAITYQSDDINNINWGSLNTAALYSVNDAQHPIQSFVYGTDGSITDITGRVYKLVGNVPYYPGVVATLESTAGSLTLPGETAAWKTVTGYGTAISGRSNPVVASINVDGEQWNYAYTNLAYDNVNLHYTFDAVHVTGPSGYSKTYNMGKIGPKYNTLTSAMDELGRTTSYQFSAAGVLGSIVYPEGNSVSVSYDIFGNVTSKTYTPKPGSGLAVASESAYVNPNTCSNVLCYRPVWYKDRLGRETDYTYNSQGQVTQETDPADATGVRRVTYTSYDAHVAASGDTLYRPNVVRVCGLTTTCGTNGEFRTEYDYWGDTFLPSAKRVIDNVAGATLTTTYTYDNAGRLLVEDGPLAGTGDAQYYRYDVVGRKTWEIGPANSVGLRVAKRYTYRDSDDKLVLVETGTVPDPTSATLMVTKQVATTYDAHRNGIRDVASTGSTTLAVADKSFDDRGELLCSTTRMNFVSLPADACTLGAQGSYGADRIVRNVYDVAGQLTQIQKAYGTSLVQNYAIYTYTANGKQQNVTDANGNVAKMAYDGLDRLQYWYFPSPTSAGTVSTTDYEQYGYDGVGNRTTLRKRDGRTLSVTYDALNRVVSKIVPDGCAQIQSGACPASTATRDVYYGYDVRGLQLYARFDSKSGDGVTSSYDGFGRPTSQTVSMAGASRTLSYAYDADGNRIKITYPDTQSFTAGYDTADHLLTMADPSGATITQMGYDGLGRRTSDFSGVETYGYDGADRMATQTLAFGRSYDVSRTFSYNPADGMVSLTRSNDAYAFTGEANVSRYYTVNGLNQYLSGGPATYSYDADGNLISDGTTTYGYDAENRLISSSSGAQFTYDPLGRLWQTSGGSSGVTQFLYDGDALVGEYDGSGNLLRRYLHGADAGDDPMFWYEGSGVAAAQRRSLLADHQGSIDLIVDGSGNQVALDTYDEFGIPGVANTGRFQYTGQIWIPELGMYYYKARFYSPTLGRFMQTDPIGYKDQINLYAYVANDPVNHSDPSGEGCGSYLPGYVSGSCIGPTVLSIEKDDAKKTPPRQQATPQNGSGSVLGKVVAAGIIGVGNIGIGVAEVASDGVNTPAVPTEEGIVVEAAVAAEDNLSSSSLSESLAIDEAAESSQATRIMQGRINDPRYPENVWGKYQYIHQGLDGENIVVHFWRNLLNGIEEGFKVK